MFLTVDTADLDGVLFYRLKLAIKVPVGLPDVAIQEGWAKSLAYWMIAKNKYVNSSIYNFSLRTLAQLLNISHECARHHYKVWQREGLVRLKGSTLTFCGRKELLLVSSRSPEYSHYNIISLLQFDNIIEQEMCIKARVVLKNINQQIKRVNRNTEALFNLNLPFTKSRLTKEETRLYKKALKLKNRVGMKSLKCINSNLQLSNNTLATLLGCSVSYAKRLKAFMNESGIITTTKLNGERVNLQKISYKTFLLEKTYGNTFDGAFYHKGNAYYYPTSIYTIGTGVSPVALVTFLNKG